MGLRDWESRAGGSLRGARRVAVEVEQGKRSSAQSELDARRAALSAKRRCHEEREMRALIDELEEHVREALSSASIAGRWVRPADVFHAIPSLGFREQHDRRVRAIAFCLEVLSSRGVASAASSGKRRRYRLATCTEENTDAENRSASIARAGASRA